MLTAVIGKMGGGKTATITYVAEHFSEMGENIYANYNLKRIPYKYVVSLSDLDNIKFGRFEGDELWLWLDSRSSSFDEYNKRISDVLLKSRKRGYNIDYTLQGFYQIDKRIRNVTDYIIFPEMFYYDQITGSSGKIIQSYLYPIDLKPYLQSLYIKADVCVSESEFELKVVDTFTFWLKDVVNAYDTTEEVMDIKNQKDKGIWVEGKFINELKIVYPQAIVSRSPNSGHYLNTLDAEMILNNKLLIFDVTSIQNRKVNGYEYFYLDFRDKPVRKFLDIEQSRKCITFIAFEFDAKWFVVQTQKIIDLLENKSLINVRDIKKNMIELSKIEGET